MRRTRDRGNAPVYAWALWTPWGGVHSTTIRRTKTLAMEVYFPRGHWRKWRYKGWRIVRVEITPIYFSTSSAKMKKVG